MRRTNKPCLSEMQGLFKKTKIDLKIRPTCETVKNTDVPENLRPAGLETNSATPGRATCRWVPESLAAEVTRATTRSGAARNRPPRPRPPAARGGVYFSNKALHGPGRIRPGGHRGGRAPLHPDIIFVGRGGVPTSIARIGPAIPMREKPSTLW